MRALSPTLASHLASNNAYLLADLYTVRLGGRNGSTVLYWTSADVDITHDGHTFSSLGPGISRSGLRQALDLEIDTLDVKLHLASKTATIYGVPIQKAALDGRLDGAFVTLERAWLTSWGSAPVGSIVLFRGTASVKFASYTVELTIKSDAAQLTRPVPQSTFQPQCAYQVYSEGCGVDPANWTVAATVTAGSTTTTLRHTPDASSMTNPGAVVTFTSGANAGITRVAREFSGGAVQLITPLPYTPAVGDTFTVLRACKKTKDGCLLIFNNLGRFRGFTDVPASTRG